MRFFTPSFSPFLPQLVDIQQKSFSKFINQGIIKELSKRTPITHPNSHLKLIFYPKLFHLSPPQCTIREALRRGKSYSCKLYVPGQLVNLNKKEIFFKWIMFGDLPLMTERGHFILNGSPRVIINQLVRSPGIYYQQRTASDGEKTFYADLIPQRGAWLRLEIDKKGNLWARMKRASKIPLLPFLQAFGLEYEKIYNTIPFQEMYSSKNTPLLLNPERALEELSMASSVIDQIQYSSRKEKEKEGNAEIGYQFLFRKFLNPKTYDLGEIGRERLNEKLRLPFSKSKTTLTGQDILFATNHLLKCRYGTGSLDDIDHLKNRKIRASGELLQNQFDTGLIRLEKTVREKMGRTATLSSLLSSNKYTVLLAIQSLVTTKPLNGALREFFGSSPLSQYMDQTNPLAEITHKRRITSVGPGGVSRETAGMAIRGIHSTYYGRICPIETPEGKQAGLVNSITTCARLNSQGFLETPYYKVLRGQAQKSTDVTFLSAEEEERKEVTLAPGDFKLSSFNFLPKGILPFRKRGQMEKGLEKDVDYVAISPIQMISVATSLIPFLEHDDANRALMGSNMQRQAVPLVKPERPLIGTGLEARVVADSGHGLQAKVPGFIEYVGGNTVILRQGFISPTDFLAFFNDKGSFHLLSSFFGTLPKKSDIFSAESYFNWTFLKQDQNSIFKDLGYKGRQKEDNLLDILSFLKEKSKKKADIGVNVNLFSPTQSKLPSGSKITTFDNGNSQKSENPSFLSALHKACKNLQSKYKGTIQAEHGKGNDHKLEGIEKNYLLQKLRTSSLKIKQSYISNPFALQKDKITNSLQPHNTGKKMIGTFCLSKCQETQISVHNGVLAEPIELIYFYREIYQFKNRFFGYTKCVPSFIFNFTKKEFLPQANRNLQSRLNSNGYNEKQKKDVLHIKYQNILSSRETYSFEINKISSHLKNQLFTWQNIKTDLLWHKYSIEKSKFYLRNNNRFLPQIEYQLLLPFYNVNPYYLHLQNKKYGLSLESKSSKTKRLTLFLNFLKLEKDVGKNLQPVQSHIEEDLLATTLRKKRSELLLGTSHLCAEQWKVEKVKPKQEYKNKKIKYDLQSYQRSNQATSLHQYPAVEEGNWVEKGDLVANCSASALGELALGKNLLLAYMPWDGYNFEDAILISDRLVKEDLYTSIHIERYEINVKDTEYGLERITSNIPDIPDDLTHLNQDGVAKVGSWVKEGDILVGKITPIEKELISPYQKLFYSIIEKPEPTTRDTSLRVPKGIQGRVISYEIFEEEEQISLENFDLTNQLIYGNSEFSQSENYPTQLSVFDTDLFRFTKKKEIKEKTLSNILQNKMYAKQNQISNETHFSVQEKEQNVERLKMEVLAKKSLLINSKTEAKDIESGTEFFQPSFNFQPRIEKERRIKSVHLYIVERRKIQVGDKLAGRHGNKGIVSRILSKQDMPYLPDGTSVDMVLNPLGVPSRMNVGQVFECLLGLAAGWLGDHFRITPFDEIYGSEASRSLVYLKLYQARLKTGQKWVFNPQFPGKVRVFDGRTGDRFDQAITVGRGYILKLVHMVDEKIHARSTGPYSLVTQQPVRGRSKGGGQRVGEMEVWALEGFGAAYALQELLTVKSDDVKGRRRVFDAILKRKRLFFKTPESFKLLVRELQCLCLDVGIYVETGAFNRTKIDVMDLP